jgi:hypothetical protein
MPPIALQRLQPESLPDAVTTYVRRPVCAALVYSTEHALHRIERFSRP